MELEIKTFITAIAAGGLAFAKLWQERAEARLANISARAECKAEKDKAVDEAVKKTKAEHLEAITRAQKEHSESMRRLRKDMTNGRIPICPDDLETGETKQGEDGDSHRG